MKKFVSFVLMIVMLFAIVLPTMIFKAEAKTTLPNELYLTQETDDTCTLTSAAMMIKSRLYLSGNEDWRGITEWTIRPIAWTDAGLKGQWSYINGDNVIDIDRQPVSWDMNTELANVLNVRKEGIVLYCGGGTDLQHAVFVTDYENGIYYCADPAGTYSKKRIPLSETLLGKRYGSQQNVLKNVTAYWYIPGYRITPTCVHASYQGCGVCKECGRVFDWESTFDASSLGVYKTTKAFYPSKDMPYNDAEKDSKQISKNTEVTVLGTVKNAYNNTWYKISYGDEKIGYVYADGYLEFSSHLWMNVTCENFVPADQAVLKKVAQPVSGVVKSLYPLKAVHAWLDDEKYASWYAEDGSTATELEIRYTDINSKLDFATLSEGKHRITLTAEDTVHGFTMIFHDSYFYIESGGTTPQDGIDVGTDFYAYIINTNHWMHLTNDDGNVTLRSETGDENQIWHFERLSDGSYKITSLYDGTCLDVEGAGTIDGTNVGTYLDNGTDAQRWYVNGYSGAYTFRARCANTVLDVKDNSNKEGTNIHMWTPNGSSAQLFQIWKVEAHTHSYSSYTVEPTCSKRGYTVYYCIGCDHSYYSDYVDALGCEYYTVEKIDPTCTEYGYTRIACYYCDSEIYNFIDPVGHYYSKWYEVNTPTCKKAGLYQSVCSTCGHVESLTETAQSTRTLWVTGINLHNDNIQKTDLEGMGVIFARDYYGGSWWIHVAFAPVWDGTYEVVDIVDGIPNGGGYALDIPEGGFVWAANYGNDYYSLGIGDTDYKNPGANECIALAKSWEIGDRFYINNVDFEGETVATSTPDLAWYDDSYECLSQIVQVMYADATGHNYHSTTKHPTCTESGYTNYSCWFCGHSYNGNYVSPEGHIHGAWVTVTEPQEGKEGFKVKYCTKCGEVVDSATIPALEITNKLLGDINGNGVIDKYDYILTKRAVMNTIELTEMQIQLADINANGGVDKYDYILLKRHVMGTFSITA